jgi:hypothetical protein
VREFGERSIRVCLPGAADRARLFALLPAECVTASAEHEIDIAGPDADRHLATMVELVRDAAGRGATIEFRAPSLEDAYVALVDRQQEPAR